MSVLSWFQSPAWLLLLIPALAFVVADAVRRWGPTRPAARVAGALVRFVVLAAVAIALADPRWYERDDVSHVVFVVDRSASIPDAVLDEALASVDALARATPEGTRRGLVLFDAAAEVAVFPGADWAIPGPPRTVPVDATDIDAALGLALGLIPAADGGEIVLLTDGRRTQTASATAVAQAKARGVAIHTLPIDPSQDDPAVGAVVLASDETRPGSTLQGTIELDGASETVRGTLSVTLGGKEIHTQTVELPAGSTTAVPFTHELDAKTDPGPVDVQATFTPTRADADTSNNVAKATVLVGDPPLVRIFTGEEHDGTALARALRAERMDVQVVPVQTMQPQHEDLEDVDLVVLANAPAASIGGAKALQPPFLRDLARYVDNGGGMLVLGGPQAYDMGGYGQSELDRVLPVKIDPVDPEIQAGATIIIILDRSGSMSAMVGWSKTKMELADEGAAASINLLRPFDSVGVMSVTETVRWEVKTQPVRDPAALRRKVMRIRADGGGIFVYTGLEAAYEALRKVNTPLKHVILFSDAADSEEKVKGIPFGTGPGSTSQDLARKFKAAGVTTSVIGIGTDDDVDTPFLKDLAKAGGGRFYLTADATKLRGLFVEETERLVDTSLHEEPFRPSLARRHPIVDGVDFRRAPKLGGYQELEARPTAEVVLTGPQDHPILTTWRYGLGHVIAWASDAGPRWAESWLTWPGYSKQWTQAARFALRSRAGDETAVEVDVAGGHAQLRIARRDEKGLTLDEGTIRARIKGPGPQADVALESLEPGLWGGRAPVEQGQVYTVEVLGDDDAVLATHTFAPPPSAERRYRSADQAWLTAVAEATGGDVNPSAITPTASAGVTTDVHRLWPWFLALALVLLPVDALLRRTARAV
ncbi:MAG: VWA domain-containing protein [Myxococcota bacterium]